jgi:monoamine oxidase
MKPITAPILIVGAGASGLMAAYELSAANREVIVLEAASEPGGRIRTLKGGPFLRPVEAGAEFIHGKLPITFGLLHEAGIAYQAVGGHMREFSKGKWVHGVQPSAAESSRVWDEMMQRMERLEQDMPLSSFLDSLTEEKFKGPGRSMRRFAEGFDLADPKTVSTRFLYREWQQEDDGQYRIVGGYARMVDHLIEVCRRRGCCIHYSAQATDLVWEQGRVLIRTADGREFSGSKAIVTVSPAILQLPATSASSTSASSTAGSAGIRFSPSLDNHVRAAGKLGFGTVTKVFLQFTEAFWKGLDDQLGFIFSDQVVPTWWTQCPEPYPLLTGWVPGAVRNEMKPMTDEELIGQSLSSLASMFGMESTALRQRVTAACVVDWSAEPFIRGGYSFDTLESVEAKYFLSQPIDNTVYFGGEALYEGPAPGTVEAALANGKSVAEKINLPPHR